jgi:CRISPR-associated protein Cas1
VPVLYVTEPGAVVRRDADSLVVTLDSDPDGKGPAPETRRVLIEVEPHRVEAIALVGGVHITSDATRFCLRRGIGVAWFTRGGDYLGRMVPEGARSGDLRLLQYAAASDPQRRASLARTIVGAKLANAAGVLRDIQSNQPGNPTLGRAIAELRDHGAAVDAAVQAEALLGIEGVGARAYFAAFGTAFRAEIGFVRRERRPPPDPANAMLSFGYVLLTNLVAGVIEARGLDPAIGFLHELRPGRASLALDLVEEFRHPLVDRFVLRLCNLRVMRPEMFEADEGGGVRLAPDALQRFLAEWEQQLQAPLREAGETERLAASALLRRQVDRIAADLRGTRAYRPFLFDG